MATSYLTSAFTRRVTLNTASSISTLDQTFLLVSLLFDFDIMSRRRRRGRLLTTRATAGSTAAKQLPRAMDV